MTRRSPTSTLFPYTTLFRSEPSQRRGRRSKPHRARLHIEAPEEAALLVARRVWQHACRTRRSEEHTSELQSLAYLVCRLLLEKKKTLAFKLMCFLPLTVL